LYGLSVAIYPAEFRRCFGEEMTSVFREQMLAAMETGDWLETLLVWKCALVEVLTVGLPLRLADSLTIATVLSASITPLVFLSLIWSLKHSPVLSFLMRRAFGI
jgi:hypothetical protein